MRALVGLIAVVALGCFKGATPPPAEPAPVQPKPPRNAALGDALGFLPADSQIVAVVDLKEVRSTAVWKRFEPTLQQKLGTYRSVFKDCDKLDPLVALRRISMGISDPRGNPHGVVVIQGFRREHVMSCLEVARAGSGGALTIANGVVRYADGTRQVMATFADDTTLVAQFGPQVEPSAFAATLDGGAPLRMSPELGELLGRIDPTHPMWLVVSDGSLFTGVTAGANAKSLLMSARIGDSVAAVLRMRFADPAQTATLATQFQGQIGPLQMMAEEVTVVADDTDLVMTVRMTPAQLDAIASLLGPVIP